MYLPVRKRHDRLEVGEHSYPTLPYPDEVELNGGDLDRMTLVPGLYKWSTRVTISSGLTFIGDADDIWIMQIAGDVVVGGDADIVLCGGRASLPAIAAVVFTGIVLLPTMYLLAEVKRGFSGILASKNESLYQVPVLSAQNKQLTVRIRFH